MFQFSRTHSGIVGEPMWGKSGRGCDCADHYGQRLRGNTHTGALEADIAAEIFVEENLDTLHGLVRANGFALFTVDNPEHFLDLVGRYPTMFQHRNKRSGFQHHHGSRFRVTMISSCLVNAGPVSTSITHIVAYIHAILHAIEEASNVDCTAWVSEIRSEVCRPGFSNADADKLFLPRSRTLEIETSNHVGAGSEEYQHVREHFLRRASYEQVWGENEVLVLDNCTNLHGPTEANCPEAKHFLCVNDYR